MELTKEKSDRNKLKCLEAEPHLPADRFHFPIKIAWHQQHCIFQRLFKGVTRSPCLNQSPASHQ